MRAKSLLAVTAAALLLVGGAAVVGATATPADQANDNATDAIDQHAPDDAGELPDEAENASENAGDAAELPDEAQNASEQAGPPADTGPDGEAGTPADTAGEQAGNASVGPSDGLPEQVPDHVSAVHDAIESFLNGSSDSLGAALSDLLGGGSAPDGV